MADRLCGADASTVRAAIESGNPLPGTGGFAGVVDGRLVRDVLGREPLYVDAASGDSGFETLADDWSVDDPGEAWSFDPRDLRDPELLDAGTVVDTDGDYREAWSLPDPAPEPDHETAVESVREAVLTSVRNLDTEGLAVAFSGGVDSAIVAAGVPDAPCYVAGFADAGPHDVTAAREAARAMGRDLRVVAFDHDDIVRAVPEIARATGRRNAMDIGIALPLYFVAEQAAADGYDRLAVGQGADELFGGYRKVVDPAGDHRVAADTVRGATRELIRTLPDQLPRDVLTLRVAGVEPVAPLLHDRVADAALRLPAELLATEGKRKIALRCAAEGIVPDEMRRAEKKAVQYGTYAARELDRLARQAGYKRRMEDHVGQYVDSLLEETAP